MRLIDILQNSAIRRYFVLIGILNDNIKKVRVALRHVGCQKHQIQNIKKALCTLHDQRVKGSYYTGLLLKDVDIELKNG